MKVLLIDDHPLVLSALTDIIHKLDASVQVRTADGPDQTFDLLDREPDTDLVLLDPQLAEGVDGFALLADLRQRHPALPVVVMAANDQLADMVRAVDLGAMAFVPKRTPIGELHAALALVLTGGVYIPQALLGLMQLQAPPAPPSPAGATVLQPMPDPSAPPPTLADQPRLSMATLGLTPRQTDVLSLLLKGLPNKLIARELSVSVDTVKDHVAAVLRALGVASRTQAVLVVSRMAQQPGTR
ncbi:response regulator [Pseudaquabacterium pictum]|uniref:DNA-binding response regulator n=1 Tax=Pseudaquabacterium pictum TaxID=2315236 RepID=A0A480AXT3_9BURK|nr:response regulator transcription factor [Rubrivivax pictus]GCL65052.1 DNA-binding response regulator [Rubrivivax pictus]